MKKILVVLTVLSGLLVSCSSPNGSSSNNPVNPVKPDQKTLVVFDNTYGVCTAIVYGDYRRRSEDIIAEVPAGQRSREMEWPPKASEPFYFAYVISLNGISGFTLNYVPKNGKDQKTVRIDANAATAVIIPRLDETFSSADQLLSPRSFLLLQNASASPFELHRGRSSVLPDTASSPVVPSGERAFYTIDPGAAVNYRLLAGFDYIEFPDSPGRFEAGHFYSYTYDGGISPDSEIIMQFDNIAVKTYTVSFNANGASGTAPAEQTVNAGTVITLPNEAPLGGGGLSMAGYTFGGWNASESGAEINYSAGASYLATGDITLYATWYPLGTVTYSATFNSNGGSMTAEQNIVSGMAAFRPANPVRTGYAFVDWYSDPGFAAVYDFSRPVTGGITLYAKWNAVLHTVVYNANGASGQVPDAQAANAGFAVTLPAGTGLSKAGHVFGGWSVDIDDSGGETVYDAGASYRAASDITLFARWNALPYTVSFASNGGSAVPYQTVYYGSAAACPEDPVKDGYTFVNWYSDSGLNTMYDFSTPVTGNITLYARYTFEWFRIMFLQFNKQYSDSVNSGEAHYYRFYVENGASYAFTSVLPAEARYESGDTFWFNPGSGSVTQTAGQSGWAYIKIDNPATYSLRIKHPETGVSAFSVSGIAGTVNEAGKTITVTVPSGTNLTSLTPTVTPASGWTCITTGEKDFTNPVEYAFAKDDAVQVYSVVVK